MKGDKCEFCEGEMEQQRILARFRYKEQTIYVENVPAWVCNKCGEQYFDAPVYKRSVNFRAREQRRINPAKANLARFYRAQLRSTAMNSPCGQQVTVTWLKS